MIAAGENWGPVWEGTCISAALSTTHRTRPHLGSNRAHHDDRLTTKPLTRGSQTLSVHGATSASAICVTAPLSHKNYLTLPLIK